MPIDDAIREELEKMQKGNELSLKPVSEASSTGKLDLDKARNALKAYLKNRIPDFKRMSDGGKNIEYWKKELEDAEKALEALSQNQDVTYKGFAFNLPHKQNS